MLQSCAISRKANDENLKKMQKVWFRAPNYLNLMNRIWEIGKKPIFEPNFNLFSQNLGPQIFFGGIYLNLKEVLPAIILYDVEEN